MTAETQNNAGRRTVHGNVPDRNGCKFPASCAIGNAFLLVMQAAASDALTVLTADAQAFAAAIHDTAIRPFHIHVMEIMRYLLGEPNTRKGVKA